VVIAASARGIEALTHLVAELPTALPLAPPSTRAELVRRPLEDAMRAQN
jgi:hypothetical protein